MRLNEPLCEYSDRWYPFLGRTITCHGPQMSLPSPNDTLQSAWYLIDRCGTGAAWIAADQAETLRKRGDTEIYAIRLQIVELVNEYLKETSSVGEARH